MGREVSTIISRCGMKKDKASAPVSPTEYLPDELISSIFEQYAHGPHPVSQDKKPPWYLGQICSRWREVALATPNLWNFFIIYHHEYESDDPFLEATRELLRRTGNSPISSLFHCPTRDPSSGFTFLAHHTSRLRCLTIACVDRPSSLAGVSGVSLESLETLDIAFNMIHSEFTNNTTPITLFDESPNLRRVSARFRGHPYRHVDLISLHLRWDRLTYLHISGIGRAPHRSVHAVLSQCSNLVDCSLSIPRDIIGDETALDTITLKHLDTLKIMDDIWEGIDQFLRCLIFPSLRRLTVGNDYALDDIVGHVQRSGCRLEEVKLATCRSEGLMFDLLRGAPSVKRFSMGDEAFLPVLVRHMGHHSFLPGLWFIECRVRDLDSTVEKLKDLRPDAFTQPISDDYPGVRVTLVIDGTEDVSKLEGLDRARLKVAFRRSYRQNDFLNHLAEEGDDVWDELPVGFADYYKSDSYQYW